MIKFILEIFYDDNVPASNRPHRSTRELILSPHTNFRPTWSFFEKLMFSALGTITNRSFRGFRALLFFEETGQFFFLRMVNQNSFMFQNFSNTPNTMINRTLNPNNISELSRTTSRQIRQRRAAARARAIASGTLSTQQEPKRRRIENQTLARFFRQPEQPPQFTPRDQRAQRRNEAREIGPAPKRPRIQRRRMPAYLQNEIRQVAASRIRRDLAARRLQAFALSPRFQMVDVSLGIYGDPSRFAGRDTSRRQKDAFGNIKVSQNKTVRMSRTMLQKLMRASGQERVMIVEDQITVNVSEFSWQVVNLTIDVVREVLLDRAYDNLRDVPAFRDVPDKIDDRFMRYSSIDAPEYTNPWVIKNKIPNACALTCLIDTYRAPLEKLRRKKKRPFDKMKPLTYETLWDILRPGEPYDIAKVKGGWIFQELVPFFKKIGVYAFEIDRNHQVLDKFEPERDRAEVFPRTIYMIKTDRHLTVVNIEDKKKISHIVRNPSELPELKVSPFTHLPRRLPDFSVESHYILEEFDERIYGKHGVRIDEVLNGPEFAEQRLTIIINYDPEAVLEKIYEMHYRPQISAFDGRIQKIFITSLEDRYVEFDASCGNNGFVEFITKDEIRDYVLADRTLQCHFQSRNHMSTFNDRVLDILDDHVCGGLRAWNDTKFVGECTELDFNKFYPACLMKHEYLPVVSMFDEFVPLTFPIWLFGGLDKLDDYWLLCVEFHKACVYSDRNVRLCFVHNLKQLTHLKFTIRGVLKCNKVKNTIRDALIDMWESDLPLTTRKHLMVSNIGKLGRRTNKKNHSFTCRDLLEANMEGFEVNCCGEYYIAKSDPVEARLIDGFRLIHHLVLDTARLEMQLLVDKCRGHNIKIIKYNIDAIYVKGDLTPLSDMITDSPNDTESIGMLKQSPARFEHVIVDEEKRFWMKLKSRELPRMCVDSDSINLIEIADEYNFSDVLQSGNRIMVEADVPGAGKTYSLATAFPNAIFVTPTNYLGQILRNDYQVETVTYAKFFGMRMKEGEMNQNFYDPRVDVTGRPVVFDEAAMLSTDTLVQIGRWLTQNPDQQVYATADRKQLAPINGIDNTHPLAKLFPNRIVLKQNKRCKTEEDQKAILDLCVRIRACKTVEECRELVKSAFTRTENPFFARDHQGVSFTNETAQSVSKHLHAGKEMFTVGQELICKSNLSLEGVSTHINYRYNVKQVEAHHVVLSDADDEFRVSKSVARKSFILPYVCTCHSLQGSSVDSLVIFDIDHPLVTIEWIYTAITRSRDLSQVFWFDGKMSNRTTWLSKELIDKNALARLIETNELNLTAGQLRECTEYLKGEQVVRYTAQRGDGRDMAQNLGIQRLPSKVRELITKDYDDLDLSTSGQIALLNLCRHLGRVSECTKHTREYVQNKDEIRSTLARHYKCSIDAVKQLLTRVLHFDDVGAHLEWQTKFKINSSIPHHPFVSSLINEMAMLSKMVILQEDIEQAKKQEKKNPESTALAARLQRVEKETLKAIVEQLTCLGYAKENMIMMQDGVMVHAINRRLTQDDLDMIANKTLETTDLQCILTVKSGHRETGVKSSIPWKDLPRPASPKSFSPPPKKPEPIEEEKMPFVSDVVRAVRMLVKKRSIDGLDISTTLQEGNISRDDMKTARSELLKLKTHQSRISALLKTDADKGFTVKDPVDESWVLRRFKGVCEICSEPLSYEDISIDRIDNNLGHEKTNCQLTHRTCNCAKSGPRQSKTPISYREWLAARKKNISQ